MYKKHETTFHIGDGIPTVMTVEEMAKYLKIGMNNAYALVRSGEIRCIRVGRQFRISGKAVQEYLDGYARIDL